MGWARLRRVFASGITAVCWLKVSNSLFGDAFIHTILRDAGEKYMAVIRTNG